MNNELHQVLYCARAVLLAALACSVVACRPAPREYSAQVINPQLTRAALTRNDTLLLLGSDASILRSRDGVAWQRAAVPSDSDLTDVSADAAGLLVAVGKQGVILRSQDDAQRWSKVADNAAIELKTVVHHAGSGAWLAAGTNGKILRSTDQANTWRSVESTPGVTFEKLFSDGQQVLIGGEAGVIGRSNDGGASWRFAAIPMPDPVTPVTGFYRYENVLIATSALGRLLISNDAGAEWTLLQTESNGYFTAGSFDPVHQVIVFTTHTGLVLRSADRGQTWEQVVAVNGYISAITYDADAKALLLAGHHGVLARSSDGGRSWQSLDSGSTADLNVLLRARVGKAWIAAGEGGSILRADAAGTQWRTIVPAVQLNLREVVQLADGEALVATGELGSVLRSTDGGARWDPITVQYPNENTPPNLRSLVVEPSGALVAAGPPGTIIRSQDGGQQWQIAYWTPLEQQEAFAWLTVDAVRGRMFAIETRSIFVSADGKQWRPVRVDTDRELWHAAQISDSGVMVVAGQRGVAARSTEAGWQLVETGTQVDLYGSYADQRSKTFYLLGQRGTLLSSSDGGQTWRAAALDSPHALRRMVQTPDGELIAFGEHGLIVRSADEGRSWQTVASGTDAELRKALVGPAGEVFLVGQRGVILRSLDAGQSWAPVVTHTRRNFRSALLDPKTGQVVAVGERIVRLSPQR